MISCAASTLLAGLIDRPELRLVEVARTPVSVHYETGDPVEGPVPVLCLATPDAVRLPNSAVTATLPERSAAPRLTVTRWWRPDRPTRLDPPSADRLRGITAASYDALDPLVMLGSGPGLTPRGDDVLAGALVAAHATADPRLADLRARVRSALRTRRTTAVSRGLLRHALDGYATPELAGFLIALCGDGGHARAEARLRAVGGTSGDALVEGVVHVLSTRPTGLEGAA